MSSKVEASEECHRNMKIIREFANIANINENHSQMIAISAIDKRGVQSIKFKACDRYFSSSFYF